MMKPHLKRYCPGPADRLLLSVLLCLPAGRLWADTPGGASPAGDCSPLYAEVVVNQRRLPDLFELCRDDRGLMMTPQTLTELGLHLPERPGVPSSGWLPLSSLPGVTAQYDPLAVRLTLTVPPGMLQLQRYRAGDPITDNRALSGPALPGLLLNYSLYTSRMAGMLSASSWSEWHLTGSDRWSFSDSQRALVQGGERRVIHLDTRIQRDFPAQALTLTGGDMTSGGPDWTRSTRLTGLQLSRDFQLRPLSGTAPDALLLGQATLPSTVDIWINDVRQAARKVAPGPFDIEGMPVRNGVNSIRMVTTDVTGKAQVRSYSLYGAASLLKAGLSDGSVEAGVPRRAWGVKDFSTGPRPVVSGSLRHGVTDAMTLEAHGEADRRGQMAGLGVQWIPWSQLGVLSAALARSRAQTGDGGLLAWGWQRTSGPLSLSVREQRVTAGFSDLASREGAALMRRSRQVFASLSTPLGSPAVGLIDQQEASGKHRYLSLSWSWSWLSGSVSLTWNRQQGEKRAQSVALWLTFPLGGETEMSLSQTSSGRSRALTTTVSGEHSDLNWRLSHSLDGRTHTGTVAEVSERTSRADLSAGVSRLYQPEGVTSLYASASGSAALLPQGMFMMEQTGEAFGLVSTSGVPDIPVRLENNRVGVTDRNGYLFLNNLQPWQANLVSLDTAAIGDQWTLGRSTTEVVPSRHGGVLAAFDVARNISAEFRLTDVQGAVLPAGSPVSGQGGGLTRVGHDGFVWLASPFAGEVLAVTVDERRCQVVLTAALIARAQKDVVTEVCRF